MAEGETIEVELAAPSGACVRVVWDHAAIAGGAAQPWRVEGQLAWAAIESLRVISASFEDGSVLGVAALRPLGAAGHGHDSVAAAMRGPEGEAVPVADALLSTEYGPDGSPRRLGLELWPPDDGVPTRVAAEPESEDATGHMIPMAFRSEGRRGSGQLHVISEG